MIFIKNGKKYSASTDYLNNPEAESVPLFNPFDDGFLYVADKNPNHNQKLIDSRKTAVLSIKDANGKSVWSVSRGLTVILGEPGSGKSFFIRNNVVPSGFPLYNWGEPDAGIKFQHFASLLEHMNRIISSPNGSGVIDSVMPMIIIEDSNLGQGGLSKRVLNYFRVLSSIVWELNCHLVLAVNPLESGNILNLWANYIRGVVHSLVLIDNRVPFLGSRIEDSRYAVVPPNRELGNSENQIRRLTSINLPTSFHVSLESLDGLNKSQNQNQSHDGGKSVMTVNPKFGEFPKF